MVPIEYQESAPAALLEKVRERREPSAVEIRENATRVQQPSKLRRWKPVVVLASTVILLGAGYLSWRHFNAISPSKSEKIMLAVLPFQNLTGDPDQEYLAEGLTDELISRFVRLNPEQLGVIARTSVMRYEHADIHPDQIGRDLSVQYVLENSLRQDGDHLRLSTKLIRVKDQAHLWSKDYDYPAKDILNVEDELAEAVAREFGIHSSSLHQAALTQPRSFNEDAFDAYMKGYYFFQRGADEKNTNTAATYFERATRLDPSYALAWVGLSRARYWQANIGLVPSQEGQQLARGAVERALTLDPNLPEVYAQMCRLKRQVDYDWAGADASIRRALVLAPGVPENLGQAAFMAQMFGRFDEALRLDRQALELDPLNAESWERIAENRFYAGQLDEAIADIKKARELNPDTWGSSILLSEIFMTQGRPQDALRESERLEFGAFRVRTRAIAYNALGREKESDAALGELIAKYNASAAFSIAMVYAYRNQRDEAFKWLDHAYAQHDGGLIFIKIEPLLKNLHTDERYAVLLKKLHVPTT
jgi:TolB-like protein/Tfp pilus assembly protein PilF